MSFSRRFNVDGRIREGSMMASSSPDGYALQQVMQIHPDGLHMREFEPGVEHEVVYFTRDKIFFPQPLSSSQLTSGLRIHALYDCSTVASSTPDYTTVFYPCEVSRSQKGAQKGLKLITYINADGTRNQMLVPASAKFTVEEKTETFPTCVSIAPVTEAHMRIANEPEAPAASAAPAAAAAPSAAAAAAAASPAAAARSPAAVARSPAVHGAAAGAGKLTLKRSSVAPAVISAAPAASAAASAAPAAPPAAAASAASATTAASSPTAPSAAATADSHKRKREEAAPAPAAAPAAVSAREVPASPASVGSSAPPSPAAKRAKKERKAKSLGSAVPEAAGSWFLDLPADPRKLQLGVKWTTETLTQLIPALASISMHAPATTTADTTTAVAAPTATVAAATAPTDVLEAHPLSKSLQVEFATWESMRSSRDAANAPSTTAASPATPSDISPFVSYRSALGQTHHFDQLKFITQKALIVAPYVLSYGDDD